MDNGWKDGSTHGCMDMDAGMDGYTNIPSLGEDLTIRFHDNGGDGESVTSRQR